MYRNVVMLKAGIYSFKFIKPLHHCRASAEKLLQQTEREVKIKKYTTPAADIQRSREIEEESGTMYFRLREGLDSTGDKNYF